MRMTRGIQAGFGDSVHVQKFPVSLFQDFARDHTRDVDHAGR